jgi:hypothetical protein
VKSMRLIQHNWSGSNLPSLFLRSKNDTYLRRIENYPKSVTHCSNGKQPYFSIQYNISAFFDNIYSVIVS